MSNTFCNDWRLQRAARGKAGVVPTLRSAHAGLKPGATSLAAGAPVNRRHKDDVGSCIGWGYTRTDDGQGQIAEMKIKAFVRCFCSGLLLTSLCAQKADGAQPVVKVTKIKGGVPAENAYIIRYDVEKPSPGSGYETGSLRIFYSDKRELTETLLPKEKSTEKNTVYNQEGITDVKLAPDKRTLGWAETFDNSGQSYSIALALAIYRSGDTILHILQGQELWYWTFRDRGKHVAAVWGPTHGTQAGDYQLYEVDTGRLVSEVFGDPATQSLRADAPEWAKETERQK